MTCEDVRSGELVERYARQELDDAAQDAFEQHYFSCAECFSEVQTVLGVRQALAGRKKRPLAWYAVGALAASLLITLGVLWTFQSSPHTAGQNPPAAIARTPAAPVAPATPAPVTKSPPQADGPGLQLLARVDPPAYLPSTLRGPGTDGPDDMETAMQLYSSRRYREAIPALAAVVEKTSGNRQLMAELYLSICQLVARQPATATKTLNRLIQAGDSPYLEEAHFYLAKAYLQANRPGLAEQELRRTVDLHDSLERKAAQLLREVREYRSNHPER